MKDPAPYDVLLDSDKTFLTPGTIVYVTPGTYAPDAPLAFSGRPTPTQPVIMAAVDANNQILHPSRSVEGTGILDVPSMPTIRPTPGTPVADAVPCGVLFHGLHMLVNLNGYALAHDPAGSSGVCVSSCHVENQAPRPGAGGLMLFNESQVVNCDVTVRDGSEGGDAGEACVRGVLELSGTSQNAAVQVVNSRLSGGRYGVIQLLNTTVANCVMRGHTEAALWNPAVTASGGVHGWAIHVTADRVGDFWLAHAREPTPQDPNPPVAPLAGLHILNCHVTNVNGYLINFENWGQIDPNTGEPFRTGGQVRHTRIRMFTNVNNNSPYRNVEEPAVPLNSLIDADFGDPDNSIDYVDEGLSDYRLVATAAGRGLAVMSGWDLGAHLNDALF